jgi:hypothetical protein
VTVTTKYLNALERMGDNELLDAIRRRDVSITDRLWWMAQASFYERDDLMRAEAKRRNLL